MMKKIMTALVFLMAAAAVFPVLFLACGSLMGDTELSQLLIPVLGNGEGFASWKLMPLYPTFCHYVELLLDSPEFFVMFWNSVKITALTLMGQILVGTPAAWGFARCRFPGKKLLFTIYIALMMMPFQVMMLSNYLVLNEIGLLDTLSGIVLPAVFSTFPVFLMYRFFRGFRKR